MTTKVQERKRKWPSWMAHDDENTREKKKTVAIERL